MPSLENLHQHFKNDEFELIAISVGENKEVVQTFIEQHGYSFVNLLDSDKAVSALYSIRSHPAKFLITGDGKLIGMAKGYGEWDSAEMKALINYLMSL